MIVKHSAEKIKKILLILLIGGIGVQTYAQKVVAVLEIIPNNETVELQLSEYAT